MQRQHYSGNTSAATLQRQHYSGNTAAVTLQRQHCSGNTTAATLLLQRCSGNTAAATLQRQHCAATLQRQHYIYSGNTAAATLQRQHSRICVSLLSDYRIWQYLEPNLVHGLLVGIIWLVWNQYVSCYLSRCIRSKLYETYIGSTSDAKQEHRNWTPLQQLHYTHSSPTTRTAAPLHAQQPHYTYNSPTTRTAALLGPLHAQQPYYYYYYYY